MALLVQLTDLHLYREREGKLAGVCTWDTFAAVLAQVRREHGDFDWLVLTGDLAQDEERDTYLRLREALGDWVGRCRIVPGNHDDPDHLRSVFPELFAPAGPLTFEIECGAWRAFGLDSHLPGEIRGHVGSDQQRWLGERLGAAPGPALLFVHHPPTPIDVAWLDELGMTDPGGLLDLIERSPQVRAVCAGHVHQETLGRIGAARVHTTPSTCVQFSRRADKAFDPRMAGYRWLELEGERYRTGVQRLPGAV